MGNIKTKRLFVAINLPMELKRELFEIQKEINSQLGDEYKEAKVFKFVEMENLHITLKFIGEVGDSQVPKIIEDTEKMAQGQKPFEIKTEKICYDNEKAPRLIWLTTNKGHITLARIKEWAFNRIEIDERPSITQDFQRNFPAQSIELMESILHRTGPAHRATLSVAGGPEYKILHSFPLLS